jgi:hypothetical protein
MPVVAGWEQRCFISGLPTDGSLDVFFPSSLREDPPVGGRTTSACLVKSTSSYGILVHEWYPVSLFKFQLLVFWYMRITLPYFIRQAEFPWLAAEAGGLPQR